MRTHILLSLLSFLFLISCDRADDFNINTPGCFSLDINNEAVYGCDKIDFYDISSHLIYLKNENTFSYSKSGAFAVFVDKVLIYPGQIHPLFSSTLRNGPVIPCAPTLYGDYIIPIEFYEFSYPDGNSNTDPRNDVRIIESLKKHNLFREGLTCQILTVQRVSANKIKIDLELTNNDSFNILYLDPDKMGLGLFHYFTNGLTLVDASNFTYTHQMTVVQPVPWNAWKSNWLSIIKSKERKTISILYDRFEPISSGLLTAIFRFPGLSYQVKKSELFQTDGRIWLGEIPVIKSVQIE